MKAMALDQICDLSENRSPLRAVEMPDPEPGDKEIRIRIAACGVCHTELDEIEGRTPPPRFPVVLGHEVVGRVDRLGPGVSSWKEGDRVGVGWIHSACGRCRYCRDGNENLCAEFRATGRDANGGYAEYMTIAEDYAVRIPDAFTDAQAAPLMCAGAIGFRSLRLAKIENGKTLGLTGFGASAHLVLKMVRHRFPDTRVHVFARKEKERAFALELGAVWAGRTEDTAPEPLEAIIDTTPAWKPVVEALRNLAPGGRLVVNAIRKEDADKDQLLRIDYPEHLWLEKEIKSVANVAHADLSGFVELAAAASIRPEVEAIALEEANRALLELKAGNIRGAKVLVLYTPEAESRISGKGFRPPM
ncbi:MAG: zinc-dependent alcohol dehydrogenase family protein, partial [Desulfobacterales bacterium]|nr:zinc-dependent alcohol dehydrogenase family protein [Desulfobacterales bacterium]